MHSEEITETAERGLFKKTKGPWPHSAQNDRLNENQFGLSDDRRVWHLSYLRARELRRSSSDRTPITGYRK